MATKRTHRARKDGEPVGSLILERDILGIGRIKKASRIPTSMPLREQQKILQKLHEMIDWLLVHRPDVLKRFRANKSQTPLQLYHAWKNDDLGTLPEDALSESFKDSFLKYLEGRTDLKSADDYRKKLSTFLKVVGSQITLNDLPTALVTYREHCRTKKTARMFIMVRAMILGFLRQTLGSQHDLYKRYAAVDKILKHKVKKGHRNGQEVYMLRQIADKLNVKQQLNLWAMCMHGLMPDEWFPDSNGKVKWRLKDTEYKREVVRYVQVFGTKTEYRDRYLPLLWPLEFPKTRSNRHFLLTLRAATNNGELTGGRQFKPYDCRRSYKILLIHAGVPVNRIDAYMGLSAESEVGKRYMELPDLLPYINKDRNTVMAYIKDQMKEHEPVNPLAAQFFEFEDKPIVATSVTVADLFQ